MQRNKERLRNQGETQREKELCAAGGRSAGGCVLPCMDGTGDKDDQTETRAVAACGVREGLRARDARKYSWDTEADRLDPVPPSSPVALLGLCAEGAAFERSPETQGVRPAPPGDGFFMLCSVGLNAAGPKLLFFAPKGNIIKLIPGEARGLGGPSPRETPGAQDMGPTHPPPRSSRSLGAFPKSSARGLPQEREVSGTHLRVTTHLGHSKAGLQTGPSGPPASPARAEGRWDAGTVLSHKATEGSGASRSLTGDTQPSPFPHFTCCVQ